MTVLMTPDMANFSGNVHGGNVLGHFGRWLMAASSVLPLLLWITGLWMWRRRASRLRK